MKKRLATILIVLAMAISILPVMSTASAAGLDDWVLGDIIEHPKSFTINVGVRYTSPLRMIFIEGGEFTLGWEDGTPGPQPEDTIPVKAEVSDYYLMDTLVTQDLWSAVMGANQPSAATRNNAHASNTYYDVHEFMARLRVLTGMEFYMPTEAQWEYAAKGGKPGLALGHNKLPFPSSGTQVPVGGPTNQTGTGAVKQWQPNILGIYNFLTDHGEWAWNDWHNSQAGGKDPTGLRGPIHGQKTRRGGMSSTGARELHSRLIRSIDGTGPTFRVALSADQVSVPPGMTRSSDIHEPKVNDLDAPNTHRDMRWVTPEGYVWEGQFRGYAGGAMKVWETGEVVMRPHNYNGHDPGDIIGQWYTFNNYGMVIIPNSDSPNPNKDRILIPYMFVGEDESHRVVAMINDRRTAHTAGPDVLFPDMLMFPTGRLDLSLESELIEYYETHAPHSPDSAADWGSQSYAAFTWFGGAYTKPIEKPAVPGLVATANLKAGEGIVDADHYLVDFVGNGRTANVIPAAVRGQDTRLVDGPTRGWVMGYGFGGIHTYRKDFDNTPGLSVNHRFSVYTVLPGSVAPSPSTGSLARGPWYTVNNLFLRTQINAGGTSYHDELYLIIPNSEGKVTEEDVHFPLRHITFMDYERGDNRRFQLRFNTSGNKDIVRHPFDQGGLTGNAGMGNTTWRQAPTGWRACPGIPTGPGLTEYQTCGKNVKDCTCPVFCQDHKTHHLEDVKSVRVDSPAMLSMSRNSTKQLDAVVNVGACNSNIVWTVSDPSFAIVNDGIVTALNKMGIAVLTASDPETGFSHSVVLRIS
ncbi:MAG: SUMF1/EgtB/PvdO family nonheme iron enzyme [Oscillospiraceae bacterium]|nr:SUMF1/EgtB/PvdO family nonheme iron enzyme [Oscillospiraceae bacterium]